MDEYYWDVLDYLEGRCIGNDEEYEDDEELYWLDVERQAGNT